MGLTDTLLLKLAPALAKSLLGIWLKDYSVTRDMSKALVDILQARTGDLVASQRGKREFEAIGEKIVENLMPIFQAENAAIDEGGRNSVAIAVAETLTSVEITPEILAKDNLDPTELTSHLLKYEFAGCRSIGEAETELYRRAIIESSNYLVDIASTLPSFSQKTFAEILRRESELLERAETILEEVRKISRDIDQLSQSEAWFEAEYRRTVLRKLDQVELFGATTSSQSRRQNLTTAYINLSVDKTDDTTHDPNHSDSLEMTVDELLQGHDRLLIKGVAGSGKTTLLKWIAVNAAAKKFGQELESWNTATPFFIRLRQCANDRLPIPDDFPQLIAPIIHGDMPTGWVKRRLESAVILVDGVDEVPESRRETVREWITDLAETYNKARVIITARPHAVESGWIESDRFTEVELLPMDLPDIMKFIYHWHSAVKKEVQTEEERAELGPLSENLSAFVRSNRAIRNLATNPLLCAMICALHRDRRQQLPTDRIELYEACCHMLLERRDLERKVILQDYPQLGYRHKCALLQDLAYWMIKNGWSQISAIDTDQRFDKKLAQMQHAPCDRPGESTRRYLTERSGVLREPIADEIDFAHRTFQEYLAAQAVLDEGDTGLLIKHADDDQWREVVILAAGRASRRIRGRIIESIIRRGDQEEEKRHELHLLAVACLETSIELDSRISTMVNERLVRLLPPKNFTEAKDLASAGELAVPYLRGAKKARATEAAASVRTLSLIGGESSLDALEDFRNEKRSTVVRELVRARNSFDKTEYTNRILQSLPRIGPQLLCDWLDLEEDGVQHLSGLRMLRLKGSRKDFRKLKDLSSLEYLAIHDCSDLRSLSSFNQNRLRILALRNCTSLEGVSPLRRAPYIVRLCISECSRLRDLTPLAKLDHLKALGLHGLHESAAFKQMPTFRSLEELRVVGSKSFRLVKSLGKIKNLHTMEVSCGGPVDLPDLSEFTNLEALILRDCTELRAQSELGLLASLKLLDLTNLDYFNCVNISNLKKLRALSLSNCKSLQNVHLIYNLPALQLVVMPFGSIKPSEFGEIINGSQIADFVLEIHTEEELKMLQEMSSLPESSIIRLANQEIGITFIEHFDYAYSMGSILSMATFPHFLVLPGKNFLVSPGKDSPLDERPWYRYAHNGDAYLNRLRTADRMLPSISAGLCLPSLLNRHWAPPRARRIFR